METEVSDAANKSGEVKGVFEKGNFDDDEPLCDVAARMKKLNGKEKSSVSHSPSAHQADSMSNDRDGKTLGRGDDGVYLGANHCVLPVKYVLDAQSKFSNSLVGFFVGKRVAFQLVQNYVTNTWAKFGFQKVMKDDDDVYYFKFTSMTGLEQVLEKGPWMIRNQPLILTKWSPNMSLSKDKVTKVPVWVKIHKVPVVAYSEDGLSLIATQIGKPIMLDTFTSAMCAEPWGRIGFARALIEVTAEKELKQEVTMAVPIVEGDGHTMERMNIEYEWKPSRCRDCKIFGHADDQCPKRVKEPVMETPTIQNDGFTMVQNQKKKGKETTNTQTRHADGFKVNKNTPKHVWNIKSKKPVPKPTGDSSKLVNTNPFEALNDMKSGNEMGEASGGKEETITVKDKENDTDSESEVEEMSHVDINALASVCSKVFRNWEWTSNVNLCNKGCRIILGWNKDVVDVVVMAQTDQAIHAKVIHRADQKAICCTFIYAGNDPRDRRVLWADLSLHKRVVRGLPWVLLGDFNVALNMEDISTGSSSMNSAMCDFKDCVRSIEVMDIHSTGLHFTWNQKPRGRNGVLKKLDRIMGNLEFIDTYQGSFLEVLNTHWNISVAGHSMFQVTQKLKILKKPIRKLMHDQGNLHDKVNRLRFKLDEVQKALDSDPSNSSLRDEEAVYVQAFNEAKIDKDRFLRQKEKIKWLEGGDSNTSYFHKSIKSINQRSRIDVVTNAENVEVTGLGVPDVFVSHYEAFIGSKIKKAMFDIGDAKALGPDGYTSTFFKKGWDVVGQDVCNAIQDFFRNEKLLKESNHTFLALIPKVASPIIVNGYRHISCCNVIYKCISKILTNRIIEGIKEVELMHNYHRNRGSPRCAFKVDIQKAYDTVDWRFLRFILKRFGFHSIMIKWIMACVTSASFSICINGNVHGYFMGKRGLRQGDLLSPYLFTLVMEILTLILQRRVHDLFIFTHGDVESASVIKASLDEFKKVSGLIPSIPKSTAFFCNVLNHVKAAILNFMPFAEGELPVNYLGVPLISSRLLNKDCKVLVEKARNRIGDWKNKSLSYSGRLQLCKSVISSMQVYWASILVIPIRIVGDIQQIIRGFLWCNGEYKRGKAKVAWDDICLPKKEGGLRLRSLEVFNLALMTTHIWNLVSNKESFCIGNGMNTSLWYDTWSTHCPLCKLLSPKDMTREGYSIHTCVADLIVNGAWNWPLSWLAKAPNLGLVPTPTLTASSQDCRKWRDTNGTMTDFTLWLIMRRSLKTQDKLRQWDVDPATDLTQVRCSLCGTQADSHEHLFFECSYSSKVWSLIRGLVGMDVVNIIAWFQPLANKRTVQNIVGKILIAAATYFIWLERNNRLFKRTRRSPEDLRDAIVITVRLKLVSFRFKNKEKVRNFLSLWKMPTAFRFYGKVV
ncbi:hypothetical protein Tco_0834626 [Tanacetum coccineum]